MARRDGLASGVSAIGLMIWSAVAHAAAPVALDGWRHIAGPHKLHIFVCAHADCLVGSRVVCLAMPRHSASSPDISLHGDAAPAKLAGGHAKPAAASSSLGLDLAGESFLIETADNGMKKYRKFSIVHTATSGFILISSSSDERASRANLARFEQALQSPGK